MFSISNHLLLSWRLLNRRAASELQRDVATDSVLLALFVVVAVVFGVVATGDRRFFGSAATGHDNST
jgi:hypothetical protein